MRLSSSLTVAVLAAVLAGFGTASVTFAEVSDYVRSRAEAYGYKVQSLDSTARSAILGQWYLEGVRQKDCIGGFFYEFRDDGYAVDQSGAKRSYEVKEDKIEIGSADISVFQMSGGGFFLPSFECGLARLVRGPALEIKDHGPAGTRRAPRGQKDRYTVRRVY